MLTALRNWLVIVAAAAGAFGAAVSVNGTCQVGNCAAPDVIPVGASPSTAFNFTVALANGDQYRIAGTVNSPNSATGIGITAPFSATYLGNVAGTLSGADTLTVDFLQNDVFMSTSGTFFESLGGGFSGPIGAGSSLAGQLFVGSHSLPPQGPFFSPAAFSVSATSISVSGLGNPLGFDLRRTIAFGAGSGVGATVYNGSTSSTGSGGSGSAAPAACDASSESSSDGSDTSCQDVICETGAGSTLPIFRLGPQPPAASLTAITRATPVNAAAASTSSCSIAMVDSDGGGSTLPILVYDPTAPDSGGGSTLPILVFDGSGGTLPILYPTGPAGGGSGTGGVIIAEGGSGSTLPIYRLTGTRLPGRSLEASANATSANTGFSIEIATPLQSIAANYTAVASCAGAASTCWITIPIASGSIAASTRAVITAIVNPQGSSFGPGAYTANVAVTITPSVGQSQATVVNLPVTLALPQSGPALTLSQTGMQFQAVSGAGAPPTQSISVSNSSSNSSSGPLSFTATASALSGNWLSIAGPAAGSTPAQVGIQANPAGLAPGTYFGRVEVDSASAVNGSQSVEVALTVAAAATGALASTTGLIFVATAAGNPAAQTVQLSTPSSQTLTVSASVAYASGSGWLTAIASAGTATPAQPVSETVAVNAAGLTTGVYLGSMDMHVAETNTDNLVEVLLVVKPLNCTPTRLLPVLTNLAGGFARTVGLPVPLVAQVVDDCGSPLTSGAAMAYFPGGNAAVPLLPQSSNQQSTGLWSGTWLPHAVAAGPATVGVMATSFTPALYGSAGVVGTLAANPSSPLVLPGGVVNAASLTEGPLAGGEFISIFGSNLATGLVQPNVAPYLTELGGTEVLLGGEPMPLQVVVPGQINAVVPYDAPVGAVQQMIVQQNAAYAPIETVVVAAAQPGVFTLNQSGQGPGAIQGQKPGGIPALNTPSNPASAGDALIVYCAGLGATSPAVPAGSAAPTTLTYTTGTVTATVGGQNAQILFAGLAPGYVGLYQVDLIVPAGLAPGPSVPVVLSIDGAQSPPVTAAID